MATAAAFALPNILRFSQMNVAYRAKKIPLLWERDY